MKHRRCVVTRGQSRARCSSHVLRLGASVIVGVLIVSGVAFAQSQGRQTVTPAVQGVTQRSQVDASSKIAAQKITLNVRENTVREAVAAAAKQAQARLTFYGGDGDLDRRVSVSLKAVPFFDALRQILKGTELQAVLATDGETVVIAPRQDTVPDAKNGGTSVAKGSVVGTVTDSVTERGLSGVAVTIRGTRLSAVTDQEGAFSISDVPVGEHMVEFKYLGYRSATQTVNVTAGRPVSLKQMLSPSVRMLSDVVTTATGEQRRIEVGHSIVAINMDSLQKIAPITSITDVLEARVPGMTIQRTSGTPGDPARIRLRGTGSIYENNDPIIVVDGIRVYNEQSDARNVDNTAVERSYATPSPLDQIDPSIIEKIEVLKGPSASALYGADAANGVIVITTKKGRAGPPEWNVGIDGGLTYQPGKWPTSTYQWTTPLTGGLPRLCIGFCGDAKVDSVVHFQALNDPYLTPLGRGNLWGTQVNILGGSPTVQYSLNVNIGRERGVLKLPKVEEDRYFKFQERRAPGWMRRPDLLEKRGGQARVDIDLSPNTRISSITLLNQSVQRRTSMSASQSSAISELQRLWVDRSQLSETPLLGNPYERVTNEILSLQSNVQLAYRPMVWLPITGQFGLSMNIRNGEMEIPKDLYIHQMDGRFQASANAATVLTGRLNTQVLSWDRIAIRAGADYNRSRTNDQRGELVKFPVGVTDPSVGEQSKFTRNSRDNVKVGWYVEPQMTLSQKFFFTPGFRIDNDGISGKNAKFFQLPKLNFSWIASEQSFFPWKEQVQMLRIRTAFGVSGVQPTPDQLHRLYKPLTANPFGGQEPLYGDLLQLSTLGNTRLRPERVTEIEGGFDVEFWNGRLVMDVTHFVKRRYDAIVLTSVAGSVDGGQNLKMNVGDLEDSGTELMINTQLVERREMGMSMSVNFSRKQSIARRLNDGGSTGNVTRFVVGYPLAGRWMPPILGYADLDENGWIAKSEIVIGATDVYVGSEEPKYTLGVHPVISTFGGRLTVGSSFQYLSGQLQIINEGGANLYNLKDGIMAPFASNITSGSQGFDRQVALASALAARYTLIGYSQKVNVTRWQSASINVALSPRIARGLRAKRASLSLQGQNLGLWTNYIGVDPNVNSNLSGRGLSDMGQQPEPRMWRMRMVLGF